MRFLFVLITTFLSVLPSLAQINGDGYYRVQNHMSKRYVYVLDDKGKLNYQSSTADMWAIQLWTGFEKACSDPATICYIENVGDKKYDIKSQGTGVHKIIDSYVSIRNNNDGTYYAYASKDGITKYLSDGEKELSLPQGVMSDAGKGDWRKWYITPLDASGSNYFGVKPTISNEGKFYTSFYTAFPYSFVSSGMNAYYVTKIENGYAIVKEITGVIPASTPVFIKVSSDQPVSNKLNIGGSASPISNNMLKGVFFNNDMKSHYNRVAYKAETMRMLGVMKDGKLGFITSDIDFIPANHSYLEVPAGSPSEIKIISEEDYDKLSSKKPESITLDKNQIKIVEGQKVTLNATVLPEDAFDKTIKWVSNNKEIAIVENGVVTGVHEGIVNVTAETVNGLKANCEVIVNKPKMPESITLSSTQITLEEGQKATLTATIMPEDAFDKSIKWVTNDPSIALMDNGVVTAVHEGIVNVTAETVNGLMARCEVIVKKPAILAKSISFDKTSYEDLEDSQFTIKATILPEETTNKTLKWTSSANDIATVDNGVVKLLKEGKATITATTTDGTNLSASCQVTVKKRIILAESISLDKEKLEISAGSEFKLTATILPEKTTNKVIKWESSNTDVATVEDGVVKALKNGITTIKATTTDGTGLIATCIVTVKDQVVLATSITLDKETYEAVTGTEFKLTATILPEDVSIKHVSWNSSDIEVATVVNGNVKVLKEGTTNITASTIDGTDLVATCIVNGVSGIEEIFADNNELPAKIYSLKGEYIMTARNIADIKKLVPGIYIINDKKVVIAGK